MSLHQKYTTLSGPVALAMTIYIRSAIRFFDRTLVLGIHTEITIKSWALMISPEKAAAA